MRTQFRRLAAGLGALALTLVLGYVGANVLTFAIVGRYSSVVVGIVVVLAAAGLAALPTRFLAVLTVLLAGGWLAGGIAVTGTSRTQAGEVAAALNAGARAGDVVVFCPDQVGPSVTRLLRVPATTRTYPSGDDGTRVNWVDYAARNGAADPSAFAASVVGPLSPTAAVWLVSSPGFLTYGEACAGVDKALDGLRGPGEQVVNGDPLRFEHENIGLRRWPAR